MQRKYRALREAAYREGVESYADLIREPGFRDFICLYVAEGYKRSRHTVSICNSDPRVMLPSDGWMRRLTGRRVDYVVTFHPDQDADQLILFWSSLLQVPRDAIGSTRKTNSGRMSGRVWRCRHGVLAISSHDTYFRARLGAWIDLIMDEWLRISE